MGGGGGGRARKTPRQAHLWALFSPGLRQMAAWTRKELRIGTKASQHTAREAEQPEAKLHEPVQTRPTRVSINVCMHDLMMPRTWAAAVR